jgi:hypothetical protein
MEFKQRLLKKQKAQQEKNRKARGFTRVKVRGRKRWVATARQTEENE